MDRTKHFSLPDDEETLVTPRFDGDEERTARPVVPLAVVSGEAEVYERREHSTYRSTPFWQRSSRPFVLVFFSALAGTMAGGAGLYLYQQRELDGRSATVESGNLTPQAQQPSPGPEEAAAIVAPTPETAIIETADSTDDEDENDDRDRSDPVTRTAESRAKPDVVREGPLKHGKKGDGPSLRPRRVDSNEPADDEMSDSDEDEARRIDSITYPRSRRSERRNRRRASVDRVRGIFEGQPEQP